MDVEIDNWLTATSFHHDAWQMMMLMTTVTAVVASHSEVWDYRVKERDNFPAPQICWNLQYLVLQSILHIDCFNASNAAQLNAFSVRLPLPGGAWGVSAASVFLGKCSETLILYENELEYIIEYDSNAWVKQICHRPTHNDFFC